MTHLDFLYLYFKNDFLKKCRILPKIYQDAVFLANLNADERDNNSDIFIPNVSIEESQDQGFMEQSDSESTITEEQISQKERE